MIALCRPYIYTWYICSGGCCNIEKSNKRSPQGTHTISPPQQLGQQQQLSLHQERDLPCDEPPPAEESLPTAIATYSVIATSSATATSSITTYTLGEPGWLSLAPLVNLMLDHRMHAVFVCGGYASPPLRTSLRPKTMRSSRVFLSLWPLIRHGNNGMSGPLRDEQQQGNN